MRKIQGIRHNYPAYLAIVAAEKYINSLSAAQFLPNKAFFLLTLLYGTKRFINKSLAKFKRWIALVITKT